MMPEEIESAGAQILAISVPPTFTQYLSHSRGTADARGGTQNHRLQPR